LTDIGAWRAGSPKARSKGRGSDNLVHGGYYTQEQIREIVRYAAARHITVVPELEMPGHSSAAIAAYPYLSCFPREKTSINSDMTSSKAISILASGGIKIVPETWGVYDDVLCAGNDSSFQFIQDVLDELLTLFPSKIIHVGGDECPKTNWQRCAACQRRIMQYKLKNEHELQSYFIKRIGDYLTAKGRRLIGWDEILEGGLAPDAIVMSWRGEEGGIEAASMDHFVVMSPQKPCYFDHFQAGPEGEPDAFGGMNTLRDVYQYEPIPKMLSLSKSNYVLGAQANVWTEYISTREQLEYMLLPRMPALSETLWSPTNGKDWIDFNERLTVHIRGFEQKGIRYCRPKPSADK
jgi:hexosaminidase